MAIIIKKRNVEPARPPAPLVDTTPTTQAAQPQASSKAISPQKREPVAYIPLELRPVATSLEQFWSNRGAFRLPEARACKKCGHGYPFPCDGASNCMNLMKRTKV